MVHLESAGRGRTGSGAFGITAANHDGRTRSTVILRGGDSFTCPTGPDVAYVQSGALTLDMVTMNGSSLRLLRIEPGSAVVDLDLMTTPAFTPCYHADGPTRIGWLQARPGTFAGTDAERTIHQARGTLLGACMRLLHEHACLQTSHRLYSELLRLMAAGEGGGRLPLPSHAQLASKLCTTRETISRELSFLRREGVLSNDRLPQLRNPGFLLASLARALGVTSEREVWQSIGVR